MFESGEYSSFSMGSPGRKCDKFREHDGAGVAHPDEGRFAEGGEAQTTSQLGAWYSRPQRMYRVAGCWLVAVLLGLAAVLLAIYLPLPVSAGTLSHILFSQRCWILAQSALLAVGVAFAWDAWRQPKVTSTGEALLTQRQAALLLAAVVLSVVVLAVVLQHLLRYWPVVLAYFLPTTRHY